MRLKKIIKTFAFEDTERSRVVLGPNVRLDPQANRLQLVEDLDTGYPLTSGLWGKTWVANPTTVHQWIGFEAFVEHVSVDNVQVTFVGYRLSDGTNQFWWNGASWVVSTANWNTETDVANHIGVFPATSKKLQVVINLRTINKLYTPKVQSIKVLYTSDVVFDDDLIYRSLIPSLRQNIRPISDYPVVVEEDTDEIDLKDDFPFETQYNVVEIDGVYNDTDDPGHTVDLFLSYDPVTMVVELNATVAAGKTVWIRFVWEPEVVVHTSQDYTELAKIPALVLSNLDLVNAVEVGPDDAVINRSTHTGTKVPSPIQGDINFTIDGITDKARDQVRLDEELRRYFQNHPLLKSVGLDEQYRLMVTAPATLQPTTPQKDIHTSRIGCRLCGALYALKESVEAFGTEQFSITGDLDVTVAEPGD